jgi:putative membrane protein
MARAGNHPHRGDRANALPAAVSGFVVLAVGVCVLASYSLGAQSAHMAIHIAMMSIAAPLGAAALAAKLPGFFRHPASLWIATAAQLVLFWGWHIPSVQQAALASHALQAAMHATLLVSSFWFWCSVVCLPAADRWQGIAALLLTGKLACLLSALLIFAPRLLYGAAGHLAGHGAMHLDDQQLAGLLMISACPLSYLVAALVIAIQMIRRLASMPGHRVLSPSG